MTDHWPCRHRPVATIGKKERALFLSHSQPEGGDTLVAKPGNRQQRLSGSNITSAPSHSTHSHLSTTISPSAVNPSVQPFRHSPKTILRFLATWPQVVSPPQPGNLYNLTSNLLEPHFQPTLIAVTPPFIYNEHLCTSRLESQPVSTPDPPSIH